MNFRELRYNEAMDSPSDNSTQTKTQSKALGAILVEKGLLSNEDLERCVNIQKEQSRSGVFLRLGEVLIDEGVLSAEAIASALDEQDVSIVVCTKCHTQYNVSDFNKDEDYKCRRCDGALTKPKEIERVAVEDTLESKQTESSVSESGTTQRHPTKSKGIAWFGDYEILGEISRGGMAIVYKARQPKLNRIVALKILLDRSEADPKDIERFRREAVAISTLRHPGIVAVFEVGEIDGVEFYTMDYIEGTTIDKAVILESLGAEEIAQIFVKICDALHFAHSRKILHRDVKPKNILLNRREEPVIVDFGIAKKDGDNELSGEFEILGSPAYLAPEYISGEANYDARSEIYAIGTTLYQLLSGKNPNDDVDTKHIFTNATSREIAPLKSIAGSVSPVLNEIVMTALSKDPNNRYSSARDMAADLRRYLDGQEVHANYSPLVLKWRVVRIKVILALILIVSVVLTFSSGYYARRLSTQDISIEELKERAERWERQFYQAKYEELDKLIREKRYKELEEVSGRFYKTFPDAKRSEEGLELRKKIDKLLKNRK